MTTLSRIPAADWIGRSVAHGLESRISGIVVDNAAEPSGIQAFMPKEAVCHWLADNQHQFNNTGSKACIEWVTMAGCSPSSGWQARLPSRYVWQSSRSRGPLDRRLGG